MTRILFASQKVFILKVMTHKEYDRNDWKDECGCYSPPPLPATKVKTPLPRKPKEETR